MAARETVDDGLETMDKQRTPAAGVCYPQRGASHVETFLAGGTL